MKTEFFNLLYSDGGFCKALGRVMLSASKLESVIRAYLNDQGYEVSEKNATLGNLIVKLKESGYMNNNLEMHFKDLKIKRNYFSHTLYDLFSEQVEETLLPRENLVPEDVSYFTEKAEYLAHDLDVFSSIVQKDASKYNKSLQPTR